MLVISFSKLIGVSLGLYIPAAFATPLLEARVVPAQNLCGGSQWLRRECVPNVSPRTWRDICKVTMPNIPPIETNVYSSCPIQTVCENFVDADQDRSIKCVNIFPPGHSSTVQGSNQPQIGSSTLQSAIVSLQASTLKVDVTLAYTAMASVSAVVLSTDDSFAIETNNPIVGKSNGVTVCQGNLSDDAQARECYPTGRYSFSEGDVINFTWGMTSGQVGSLAYTIWPTVTSS